MNFSTKKIKESKVFIFCHGMISCIKYIGNIRLTKRISDNLTQKKFKLIEDFSLFKYFFGTPKKNNNQKDVYKTNLPQFDHVSADLVSPA